MSDNTLKYFMWGWQPHFQISARLLAERLFTDLDPRFQPQVFLLGFIRKSEVGCYDVCVEPEKCGYRPEWFKRVREIAREMEETDPRAGVFHSHPQAHADMLAFIGRRSIHRAVEKMVSDLPQSEDLVTYCSYPVLVDRYDVVVVLQLQAEVFDSHYHLAKESLSWDGTRVARSYLDATALMFLDTAQDELQRPEAGKGLGIFHRHYTHVPRDAGRVFANRIAHATDRFGMAGDLFDTFNAISAMFYERRSGTGSLVLAENDHSNVRVDVRLAEPVRLQSHRAVRRLVELSARGTNLLSDGEVVYGLGEVQGQYDPAREDLFVIGFTDHYSWSASHDGNVMMRVAHNLVLPLLPRLDHPKLASDMKRIFSSTEADIGKLVEIVEEAAELGHGAQIVISSRAEEEAKRLAPQATVISPIELTPSLLRRLCAVDGAVLLDPEGRCHAFGVILDGLVSAKGDRSRGSRYNSAIRYADGRNDCLIVVISDDETIDMVPDLRPQISRAPP